MQKVYLAADHAGFELKEKIKTFLIDLGYEIKDFGAFELNPEDDYPDFIMPAIKALRGDSKNGIESKAVIFGGSGQGEAMIANRFKGVRAAVYYGFRKISEKLPSEAPASIYKYINDPTASPSASEGSFSIIIKLSREHNNANCLSLGARFLSEDEAKKAVKLWLETAFPNPDDKNWRRHQRRIDKIDKI